MIDPREMIANAPMSFAQKQIIFLTSLLCALDGFDILSVTFVAPVIAKTFHAGPGALGILLSSGLAGMLIGSLLLAALADIIGRRPVVLISLLIMVVGMLAAAFCRNLIELSFVRLLTGVGMGAAAVVINPIAVEFSNQKNRALALSLMSVGYPAGGMIGGAIAALLLHFFSWRAVFLAGALLAVVLAPFLILRLPESLSFLLERRDGDSLSRVNALLVRLGHAPMDELPPPRPSFDTPYLEIFKGRQRRVTVSVSMICLLAWIGNYYFLSWHPKLLVDLGFTPSGAASVAGASSFAGACGCIIFGVLSRKLGGRRLALISILGLAVSLVLFGIVPSNPVLLIAAALSCGAFLATSTVGLYVTAADVFELRFRATGTGFMIGIGRIGAIIGPSLAGSLFAMGGNRASVSVLIGFCVLVGAILLMRLQKTDPPGVQSA